MLHVQSISSSSIDLLVILFIRVQVKKVLIFQFSSASSYFLSLRSKHSLRFPVLKHPQSVSSSCNARDQVISRKIKFKFRIEGTVPKGRINNMADLQGTKFLRLFHKFALSTFIRPNATVSLRTVPSASRPSDITHIPLARAVTPNTPDYANMLRRPSPVMPSIFLMVNIFR
jgi:hypothetical protein